MKQNEQTLVIIKPDGVQRTLVGEVIRRYERVGLKLVALKMLVPTEAHVEQHYTYNAGWIKAVGEKAIKGYIDKGMTPPETDPLVVGNTVLSKLKSYLTAGPVIAMVWQGAHAVAIVRKITGGTEPLTSDVGTIRGDFVLDSYEISDIDNRAVRNIVHASGNVDEANVEIKHWFSAEEILSYTHVHEAMLYDVNIDGRKE